jgi:cell division protein FtsL
MPKRAPVNEKGIARRFFQIFFNPQVFPICLFLMVMGILFVLFRMKSVETDYKISEVNKKIRKITLEKKQLEATKAKLLSIKSLRKLAYKYELQEPKQNQIIIIPES